MSFLTLTSISKVFETSTAVHDFNLSVEQGEFVSFLGPSGCGKTTTLRMIAGFERPTAGTIAIDGRDITHASANQRNVGMVFQSYALFPNMTVADNVGFGLRVARRPRDEIRQTVAEMLDVVRLAGYDKRYPHQLSGGQQQRVALARALAIHPQVLLLDEPLSALDAKIRLELRVEIRRIQRELGITTIYVTHDQEEALSLSDRIVVMNAGHIEQIGTPFEIYNYPKTGFVGSFIGQINIVPVEVVSSAGVCSVNGQQIRLAEPLAASPGAVVNLAIRPEELTLQEAQSEVAPNMNCLQGRIDRVTFLGSIVRAQVEIDGGSQPRQLAVDTFNERQLVIPRVGTPVQVVFPCHACWPVAED